MEKALHIKIIKISLIVTIISLVGIAAGLFINREILLISPILILLIALSLISFFVSYAIVHPEKSWIHKAAKYSLIFYPLLGIVLVFLMPIITPGNPLPFVVLATILFVFTFSALMHIFLFTDAKALTGTIILLSFIIIAIIFKRYHLQGAGVLLIISLSFFSIGSFMFGIRCLFLAEKNSYFKYLSFFGSCFITISFTGLLFKLMHWPGGGLLKDISNFAMVIGTIAVLLTLPSSGYIDWHALHKKILARLLIPWMFIFAMFIMSFLLPETFKVILGGPQEKIRSISFEMPDYNIENKNGLKPE